jgi:anti-sigma-K factor RskA
MTDDELREQLALHAVGALTDAERRELEDALRSRPDLRAELDELEAAAATLADAVPATPPTALRASVLDAIAVTPQLPAEPRGEAPVAPVVPISAGRRRTRFAAIGAAAAAVVAIAVGVLVVAPWSDDGTDQVAAVVDAGDAVEILMPGTLPGVTIVHSADEDASVLLADGVPVPEGDAVYALWAIRDGTPEHVADFRPEADGHVAVYAAGLDPASAEQWAISAEPGPDATTPTDVLNAT